MLSLSSHTLVIEQTRKASKKCLDWTFGVCKTNKYIGLTKRRDSDEILICEPDCHRSDGKV